MVLLASGIAAVVLIPRDGSPGGPATAAAAAGGTPTSDGTTTDGAAPTTSDDAAPATPGATPEPEGPQLVSPRSAITDPELFAFAEPYLTADSVCFEHEQQVNVQESVSCLLDDQHVGLFTKMFTPEVVQGIRQVHLDGALATPDSTRSLRWKFVPGRPGVRTGIPAQRAEQGDGLRIRFLDQRGQPQLYFDQESVACHALLGLSETSADPVADLDALRSYWADPTP